MLEHTKSFEHLNPIYLHLDIDVLVVNDIRKLNFINSGASAHPDRTTIFLRSEETITGDNYFGALMTDEDKLLLEANGTPNFPGFSAGIFGWMNNKYIKEYFHYILTYALRTEKLLYTVDQPFFNAAVFQFIFKTPGYFNFVVLDDNSIGHNIIGAHMLPSVVLTNFCGEPGIESVHWNKMFYQLILQTLGS